MKKIIYLLCLSLALISCGPKDDIDNYSETATIRFTVTASDTERLSEIITTITSGVDESGVRKLHIVDESYGNDHLQFTKEYINQTVYNSTFLGIQFQDNSGVEIGVDFVPYTVALKIYVNDNVVSEKEFLVNSSRVTDYTNYTFSFFN